VKKRQYNGSVVQQAAEYLREHPEVLERIMSRTDSAGDTDSCWRWPGAMNGGGVPVGWINGRALSIRGVLFRYYAGCQNYPSSMRKCTESRCVNPWHTDTKLLVPQYYPPAKSVIFPTRLFPSSVVKVCKQGHSVLGPNAYVTMRLKKGKKVPYARCRICHYLKVAQRENCSVDRAISRITHELEQLARQREAA
jgi:hypothetical protein